MSLSHAHRQLGPGPADLEFRALETAVEIVPKFKMDAIDALDGVSSFIQLVTVPARLGGPSSPRALEAAISRVEPG